MKNDEVIRFAGDINIDKAQIITATGFSQDIKNQVMAIEFYEDMFAPFISGLVVVKETLDYANLFPLIGEEYITLTLRTPSFEEKNMTIDDQFVITKVKNRAKSGERNLLYEIHFMSREALVDVNKKISKAFEGKVSEIAQSFILDKLHGLESNKDVYVEESANGIKYISNYWSPITNLNYLSQLAKNSSESSDYIFFENRRGFNFMSISRLYSEPVKQNFISDGFFRKVNQDGSSTKDVFEEYRRITNIEVPVLYDYIDRAKSGMMASRQIKHDLVTKKYTAKNFDILDDYDDFPHLNQNAPVSSRSIRKSVQKMFNSNSHYGAFNGYKDTTASRSIQQRVSQINLAQMHKIQITVPGRTDYTVGDKVYLELTKNEVVKLTDDEDQNLDKILSGNYIVSSLNHFITRENHECVLELIKDSYILNLEENL